MSDSLRPHELQHARPPCPSLSLHLLKLMSVESVMPSRSRDEFNISCCFAAVVKFIISSYTFISSVRIPRFPHQSTPVLRPIIPAAQCSPVIIYRFERNIHQAHISINMQKITYVSTNTKEAVPDVQASHTNGQFVCTPSPPPTPHHLLQYILN